MPNSCDFFVFFAENMIAREFLLAFSGDFAETVFCTAALFADGCKKGTRKQTHKQTLGNTESLQRRAHKGMTKLRVNLYGRLHRNEIIRDGKVSHSVTGVTMTTHCIYIYIFINF